MAIVKNVEFRGSKVISTNNGNIKLDESAGELIVRKNGNIRTRVNAQGFIFSAVGNLRRILIGADPANDDDVISVISDPGIDVIDEASS